MKKIISAILSAAIVLSCLFAFTACGGAVKVKVFKEYDLTAESYAFVCAKSAEGTNPYLTAANELLAEIKQNGQLDEIINSFFNGEATFTYTNPVATTPTNHSNYLIVATNAQFPPFEYLDGNKFTGVDIKIASLLASKMNQTLYVLDEEFDSVISSVSSGIADIGMAGLTVNDERKRTIDFSSEYYESAQVLICREDDDTFKNVKSADDIDEILKSKGKDFIVGTQNATTGYMFMAGDEDFGYDGYKNITTKGYTNGALAVKDLSNKKINAVVIDKQPAIMIAESTNKTL